jgi:hypothetical protein
MLVGREDGFVLSCQFIISLNCVFSVCVCESESVCVCINIYIVAVVVVVNLLLFYSLQ